MHKFSASIPIRTIVHQHVQGLAESFNLPLVYTISYAGDSVYIHSTEEENTQEVENETNLIQG